jgi:hypothetical protein
VVAQIFKCCSVSLCPNIHGQIAMDLFQSPSQPGDELFVRHAAERKTIYESQKRGDDGRCIEQHGWRDRKLAAGSAVRISADSTACLVNGEAGQLG